MSYSSACKFWRRGKFEAITIARKVFESCRQGGGCGRKSLCRLDNYHYPEDRQRTTDPDKSRCLLYRHASNISTISVKESSQMGNTRAFSLSAPDEWKTTEIKLLDENIIFVLKRHRIHMSSTLLQWISKKSALSVWNRTRDIHLSWNVRHL